jgi:hypothetical protein
MALIIDDVVEVIMIAVVILHPMVLCYLPMGIVVG